MGNGYYTNEKHKVARYNPDVKHKAPQVAATTMPSFAAGRASAIGHKQTVLVPVRTGQKPTSRGK